jgi:hypothetical protein
MLIWFFKAPKTVQNDRSFAPVSVESTQFKSKSVVGVIVRWLP